MIGLTYDNTLSRVQIARGFRSGAVRVELVDPRCGLRLASLDPRDASALAGRLVAASARAGWQAGHEPGT